MSSVLSAVGEINNLSVFKLLTTDERFALQGSDWCVNHTVALMSVVTVHA